MIIQFPKCEKSNSDLKKAYSLDVISKVDVDGMVLIEGCVPRAALKAILQILRDQA